MPIYEYECPSCGRIEVIQKFSDKALTECPHCAEKGKRQTVQKAVSAAAFHLKGGGWYKTDYASGSSASSGGASSSASSSSSSANSSSTNSDTGSSGSPDSSTPAKKAGCGTTCGCH